MKKATVFDKARAFARRRLAQQRRRSLARLGYKIVRVSFPNRIGHLCVEVDALLKQTLLAGGDPRTLYLPDIGDGFANRHLVEYFKRYLTMGPDLGLVSYLEDHATGSADIIDTHPLAVAMYASAEAYGIFTAWGDRPPLFELTNDDARARAAYMKAAGMPDDAWYVCLHAREGGYSAIDEVVHRHRSIAVESFAAAVEEILNRGGWVIRMGDATMRPFSPSSRVIDYARSPLKSAQLDVALTAGCRFFLGSSSGLYSLAGIFGRPSAVAHMSPLGGSLPYSPYDISTPQTLVDSGGTMVPLRDIMSGDVANYRLDAEFTEHGLKHVPNAPEDIRNMVIEMFERLDGTIRYTEADHARRRSFGSLFHQGHYSFGAASSVSRAFLERYF